MKTYFTYIVRCADGSFYVGVTSAIEKRIAEHNLGVHRSCYTFKRRPVTLVWSQDFSEVQQAIAAEKQIKGWRREKKMALIRRDFEALKVLSRTSRNDRRHIVRQAHDDSGGLTMTLWTHDDTVDSR